MNRIKDEDLKQGSVIQGALNYIAISNAYRWTDYRSLANCRRYRKIMDDVYDEMIRMHPLYRNALYTPEVRREIAGMIGLDASAFDRAYVAVQRRFTEVFRNSPEGKNIHVAMRGTPEYPEALAECKDAPRYVYWKGDITLLDAKNLVSVVGNRKLTDMDEAAIRNVGCEFAEKGMTVVNGLARGTDYFAADSALRNGGRVIGFTANTIDCVPDDLREIYGEVAANHLLLSAMGPGQFGYFTLTAEERSMWQAEFCQANVAVRMKQPKGGTAKQMRDAILSDKYKVVVISLDTLPADPESRNAYMADYKRNMNVDLSGVHVVPDRSIVDTTIEAIKEDLKKTKEKPPLTR